MAVGGKPRGLGGGGGIGGQSYRPDVRRVRRGKLAFPLILALATAYIPLIMKLTLLIRQGKTALIGQLQEIPGVLTQGQTVAEVRENIQDALALYLEDMREDEAGNDPAIIAREELELA